MEHPFFKPLDVGKLLKKEIEAPYKPKKSQLTLDSDTIDPSDPSLKGIFANEDEIADDRKMLIKLNQGKFKDF